VASEWAPFGSDWLNSRPNHRSAEKRVRPVSHGSQSILVGSLISSAGSWNRRSVLAPSDAEINVHMYATVFVSCAPACASVSCATHSRACPTNCVWAGCASGGRMDLNNIGGSGGVERTMAPNIHGLRTLRIGHRTAGGIPKSANVSGQRRALDYPGGLNGSTQHSARTHIALKTNAKNAGYVRSGRAGTSRNSGWQTKHSALF
jgi:hypothetical protein